MATLQLGSGANTSSSSSVMVTMPGRLPCSAHILNNPSLCGIKWKTHREPANGWKWDSCGLYWVPCGFSSFHPPTWDCGNNSMTEEREAILPDHRSLAKLHDVWNLKKKKKRIFFLTYSDNVCSLNSPSILTLKKMFMGRGWWNSEVFWHEWRIMMYCS